MRWGWIHECRIWGNLFLYALLLDIVTVAHISALYMWVWKQKRRWFLFRVILWQIYGAEYDHHQNVICWVMSIVRNKIQIRTGPIISFIRKKVQNKTCQITFTIKNSIQDNTSQMHIDNKVFHDILPPSLDDIVPITNISIVEIQRILNISAIMMLVAGNSLYLARYTSYNR